MRTVTTLSRLLDVLSLTSGDRRIQTFFTHDAQRRSRLGAGVEQALAELGVPFLPWSEAVATRFDLAVAASENDQLADLDAPVLLLPHGAGQQKFYPDTSVVSGLNPDRLVVDGRVVPAAIALPHASHLERLRRECPPAADRGVIVGDPALARMAASAFRAGHLRSGFGVPGTTLIVIASTYGPDSVFGRLPDLPERLVAALPADEFRIALVLHPGVWAMHSPWQVRAWLAQASAYGIRVVPPQDGWQATVLAADVVISDHGSLAVYAAALGKPVIVAGRPSAVTVPGSAAAVLAASAPVWDPAADPREQLTNARPTAVPIEPDPDCAPKLRSLMYRLIRLDEPPTPAGFGPVTAPPHASTPVPAHVVGASIGADGVRIERYADLGIGDPHTGLDHRHLVADIRTASLAQMAGAAIVVTPSGGGELRDWPQATMTATPLDDTSCAIRTSAQGRFVVHADGPVDPIVLASWAYVRLPVLPRRDQLHLDDRTLTVTVEAA